MFYTESWLPAPTKLSLMIVRLDIYKFRAFTNFCGKKLCNYEKESKSQIVSNYEEELFCKYHLCN